MYKMLACSSVVYGFVKSPVLTFLSCIRCFLDRLSSSSASLVSTFTDRVLASHACK